MNNLPVRANESPLSDIASRQSSYPAGSKLISTIALLVLGYYVLSFFDTWPSTLKRYLHEAFIYLFPSPLLYAMQQAMVRFGRLSLQEADFTRAKYGDIFAKQEAIHSIFGHPRIPLVLRKVRSLSGARDYVSLSNDNGPPGLGNWDNSCYQNSVLQGLASLPKFLQFMERSLGLCDLYSLPAATHQALVVFLEQLTDSSCRKTTLWTPSVLKSMDSWQQQDAQEYFSRVLEAVEKEATGYIKRLKRSENAGLDCLTATKTCDPQSGMGDHSQGSNAPEIGGGTATSPLRLAQWNPIDGMTGQVLECTTCGFTEGFSLTQFNCLTLNLGLRGPCDVENLLDEYTSPEEVEGVECENCTKLAHGKDEPISANNGEPDASGLPAKNRKPPILRTKTKQITLARLPSDLVLHINRSIFDEDGNQLKNTAPVKAPAKLDFLRRWCSPLAADDDNSVELSYQLRCIVTHYGRHENGHYVALGKRGKDWYSFNDEIVAKITEQEVLSRGNGFMLFYEAIPYQSPVKGAENETSPAAGSVEESQDLATKPQVGEVAPLADSFPNPETDARELTSATAPSTESSEKSASSSGSTSSDETSTKECELRREVSLLPMKTATQVSSHEHEQHPTAPALVSAL